MTDPVVDILMYHSVSYGAGPTCIAPGVFADQMRAIAEARIPVLSLDDLAAARAGGTPLPARSAIITFDDGFTDFAEHAWPVMEALGFRPVVYLPTGFVGRAEGWRGIADPPRALMGWDQITALARAGVQFGSHTISHPDLNSLSPDVLRQELTLSRDEIAGHVGQPVRHFAPPYGLARRRVRAEIARHYVTSVGTRLAEAGSGSDLYDLPRLEMHYFTDGRRWREHLAGQGGRYLAVRRTLRAVKSAAMKPWMGI